MQQILISPELKGREAEADFSPNIQKKKNSLLKLKREKKTQKLHSPEIRTLLTISFSLCKPVPTGKIGFPRIAYVLLSPLILSLAS